MNLQVGKTYEVYHQRKGQFIFKLKELGDPFVTGIIVKGQAKAKLEENERYEGEEITIRKEFCTFKELLK